MKVCTLKPKMLSSCTPIPLQYSTFRNYSPFAAGAVMCVVCKARVGMRGRGKQSIDYQTKQDCQQHQQPVSFGHVNDEDALGKVVNLWGETRNARNQQAPCSLCGQCLYPSLSKKKTRQYASSVRVAASPQQTTMKHIDVYEKVTVALSPEVFNRLANGEQGQSRARRKPQSVGYSPPTQPKWKIIPDVEKRVDADCSHPSSSLNTREANRPHGMNQVNSMNDSMSPYYNIVVYPRRTASPSLRKSRHLHTWYSRVNVRAKSLLNS